ncbi:tripartite tricarboxylate transporter substrate binding protein [Piscinibacter sp.]|uniref:tripartite tricarboxylate transporter substrate binding protein n=1 Tax=Piscinibacter sp. TaxID=1903157 RepID=UPI002C2CA7A5|nr:tripartite tricarboxylate transporter substrate binding protein [Albitalea sp.]HUG21700.1 tripartite tricarboxylate transporter substrate binding protein [Albitalea sp.]
MTSIHRRAVHAALVAATALAFAGPARAQGYPDKPIHIVVPYAPGGPTDIVARLIGNKLSEQLGQPVIVDNKGGAGGNLGAEAASQAAPDGYTLLLVTTGHTINPSLYPKLGYDLVKDFAPVSQLISSPMVVAVTPSLPVINLAELIALAKAKPGELNFASAGNGSSTHLAPELFDMMAGIKMTHVPYKGSAPALGDVIGGHAQVAFDYMISAMQHVRSGKLKGLAVTSAARSPAAPELPTVAEAGVPGFEVIGWNGLMAPAGTPKPVIDKLNAAVKKALASPDIVAQVSGQGSSPHWSSADAFGSFVRAEVARWGKVVHASGAKIN